MKGLDYLDTIYHAIVNEHPIQLKYRSFKARSANSFIFYPYLLKEYRNRWFVYGVRGNGRILQNLALDRIQSLEVLPQEHYIKNTFFDPNTFFDDLVGVTKNSGSGESWLQSSGSRSTLHHNQAYTSQSTTGGKAT